MFDPKDKVFYVTGGASGLGLATVVQLVKAHAYVALLDLNEEEGEKIAKTYQEVRPVLLTSFPLGMRAED